MSDKRDEHFLQELVRNKFKVEPAKIRKSLNEWQEKKLNIGFIGERGCGKSTFINSLRGLYSNQQGAAPVGVDETTVYPTPYAHPNNENALIWDLPGVNTPKFPLNEYLKKISRLDPKDEEAKKHW